jgi:hypothetical protein
MAYWFTEPNRHIRPGLPSPAELYGNDEDLEVSQRRADCLLLTAYCFFISSKKFTATLAQP